eukprot:3647368-Prymnesium_polylepis.2
MFRNFPVTEARPQNVTVDRAFGGLAEGDECLWLSALLLLRWGPGIQTVDTNQQQNMSMAS